MEHRAKEPELVFWRGIQIFQLTVKERDRVGYSNGNGNGQSDCCLCKSLITDQMIKSFKDRHFQIFKKQQTIKAFSIEH